MLDIAIIGGGPAALSAAITARQRNKETTVFQNRAERGWLQKAEEVNNYPGMYKFSGKQMLHDFSNHALQMGANMRDVFVRQIMNMEEYFAIMAGDDILEAKTIILATGAAQPKMLVGEESFVGNGVSYCGTCDGMLFRGKKVAVLGFSRQAIEEANYLSGLASEAIYITDDPKLMDGLNENIQLVKEKPLSIEGTLKADRVVTNQSTIEADGIFIFRDAVAFSNLIGDVELDRSFIKVNRRMETNIHGLFAAGDCTGQPLQVAKAVGEGNIAAISASEYIDRK